MEMDKEKEREVDRVRRGGVRQRERMPSVIEIYSVQSAQRNTSLFWDVKLRWTTRTLALQDALRVCLSVGENVCARENGINKKKS